MRFEASGSLCLELTRRRHHEELRIYEERVRKLKKKRVGHSRRLKRDSAAGTSCGTARAR